MTSETKRALITGASSGVGTSTTIAFTQSGSDLAVVNPNPSDLALIVQKMTEYCTYPRTADLNLITMLQSIQKWLLNLRQQQCKTSVNNVSIAGQQIFLDRGAYCVDEYGFMALTKTFLIEEWTTGIRVVAVSSESVNSPLSDTDLVMLALNGIKSLPSILLPKPFFMLQSYLSKV